jgi:hypothetical protein
MIVSPADVGIELPHPNSVSAGSEENSVIFLFYYSEQTVQSA